jgi:dinuclear metal center YbgI/SA1388 family protein
MKVARIAEAVESIAALKLAQDWDNVGLLVGDPERRVTRVLLAIDVTVPVVEEASGIGAGMIVSYHPVIWDKLSSVTGGGPGNVVWRLARSNIAVFCVHTALDAAVGGVNDGLAGIVGITGAEPIGRAAGQPQSGDYKLVVFVPHKALRAVCNAVFAAGAGRIGNYARCGFRSDGRGSFLPLAGARPAVGAGGGRQEVGETRFETVVGADRLDAVVAAMKDAHPYETPAYDCYRLYEPAGRFGLGRIGPLSRPQTVDTIIRRLKKGTAAKAVGIVGSRKRLVRKAAVCAGSCGKVIRSVIAAGADLYVTGELGHHRALAAEQAGMTVVCLGHSVSERFILAGFAGRLRPLIRGVSVRISARDRDPFRWEKI